MTVAILLGAPGAGKGTQAPLLAASLGVPVLASGDLLRAEVASGSEIGREVDAIMRSGELVPDDLMARLFLARLDRPDAAERRHPRRLPAHEAAGRGARRGAQRIGPPGRSRPAHRGARRGPDRALCRAPHLQRRGPRVQRVVQAAEGLGRVRHRRLRARPSGRRRGGHRAGPDGAAARAAARSRRLLPCAGHPDARSMACARSRTSRRPCSRRSGTPASAGGQ